MLELRKLLNESKSKLGADGEGETSMGEHKRRSKLANKLDREIGQVWNTKKATLRAVYDWFVAMK